jgi:RES domain-containing protein
MKLWRLARAPFLALDGSGPAQHGARWTSPGLPVVNFASEPGLSVLVVLRYLPRDLLGINDDYLLGWTESDVVPERIDYTPDPVEKRKRGDDWLRSRRSLFAAVTSAVLPEADIIMMNPKHLDAAALPRLRPARSVLRNALPCRIMQPRLSRSHDYRPPFRSHPPSPRTSASGRHRAAVVQVDRTSD